jgi:hypothetical protein
MKHAKTERCMYHCPHCPKIFAKEPIFNFHLLKHAQHNPNIESKQEISEPEPELESEIEFEYKSETTAVDTYKCSDCLIVFAQVRFFFSFFFKSLK